MAMDKVVDSAALDAGMSLVADAIRAKAGTTDPLAWPDGFKAAVEGIQTGGGVIDTSDGTISATDVLSGKVGYAGGVRIVGTMPDNGAVNASIDGTGMTEYTIPKGYHNGSGKVSFAGTIETWSFTMESGSVVTKRVFVS